MRSLVLLAAAVALVGLASSVEAGSIEDKLKKLGVGASSPKQEPKKTEPEVKAAAQSGTDEDCDRLTAAEYDQDLPKAYPRVLFADIDAPRALAACEASAAAHPKNRHYIYAWGRALAASDAGDKAREILLKAANMGSAAAMNHIGAFYLNGYSVAVDYAEAISWFEKALKRKSPYAMHNLGLMYIDGSGVTVDEAKGADYLVMALKAGGIATFQELSSNWDSYPAVVGRRVERLLIDEGFLKGKPDGKADESTMRALSAYKASFGP